MATAHVLQQTEWSCYCCRHKLEKPDCRQQDENQACCTFRNVGKVGLLCISDNFVTFYPFHVTLLFSFFILEEHNICTGTLGIPAIYVDFHTFQDFGTSEVYQVTKDDENLKCWKVSQAKVCQQLRGYISAMQAMSDEGEKIEIDKVAKCVF